MLEKDKYKLFLLVVKVIPMVMAFIFFINTILSYFDIDIKVFNYITCIGILPLIILYAQNYLLHFCEYHRIFLHYIVLVNIINIIDVYIGIPISNYSLLKLHCIIAAISLFLILYFKKIRR